LHVVYRQLQRLVPVGHAGFADAAGGVGVVGCGPPSVELGTDRRHRLVEAERYAALDHADA
jgi:hypothetical protein